MLPKLRVRKFWTYIFAFKHSELRTEAQMTVFFFWCLANARILYIVSILVAIDLTPEK
ncbi:hypothetical protein DSO57_1031020 [Entomophthora muscae]|uniref:Uncharacterized protein n=1 Tax=Entomophthora muscae TaxID=34485 RepID=A0ACC2UAK9_9FUNG|nr:hypothetical protein DSO57_1031020 [Entomophthora muscae]